MSSQITEIRVLSSEELIQQQAVQPILPPKYCVRCRKIIPVDMRYRRSKKYKGLVCQRCDSALWRSKGYAFELDFCRRLKKLGYGADRIPTSGGGGTSLPDVIVNHYEKGIRLAFELKLLNANAHKSWMVYAWKKDKKGKLKPSQLVKAVQYLQNHMSKGDMCKAGAAIKFVLGERVKSPIIVKLFDVTKDMKLKDVPDLPFDISDSSDMPELTAQTLSKRSRKIRKVRKDMTFERNKLKIVKTYEPSK